MKRLIRHGWPVLLLLACPLQVGCQRTQAQAHAAGKPPDGPPPEVKVSLPVQREVTDYEDFPGRTEAVNSIEIRARVTGHLEQVHFKEGAEVRQGDPLFDIDPRWFQADLARAEGTVIQTEGRLKRLEADYQRALTLLPKAAMGREDFDRIVGDRAEAVGALAVAKASRDQARLNLEYCKVRAPISGQISRRYLDPGNLVKADDTVLTTLVSLNPIYAYFDVDERTTLKLQRLVRERKIKWSLDEGLPVQLGLADEEGFSQQGTINFADNRVDADTGTWRLRALFANPDRTLTPGLFVRLRAPVGTPYPAILVCEQALSTDQGQKFVYVVDDANKVDFRRVKVGRLHDGLRVITEGLSAGEKVVVSGLQRVRQGITVDPKVVAMPTVSGPETAASVPPDGKQTPKGADKVTK